MKSIETVSNSTALRASFNLFASTFFRPRMFWYFSWNDWMPMLSFVTPASFSLWSVSTFTLSGCSSTPMPSVTVKCSRIASMISLILSAIRAGVPPPKYRLVVSFLPLY